MITIKAPLTVRCARPMLTAGEDFSQRIIGNYELFQTRIVPEDMLHLLTQPPEVYVAEGETTLGYFTNTQIVNQNIQKATIVNNLLNRILLGEEMHLTYQDQVFITDALTKLGITNIAEFMHEVQRIQTEQRNFTSRLSLYWNQSERLQELVEQYIDSDEYRSAMQEIRQEDRRSFLHQEIFDRLKTASIYQIMTNFVQQQGGFDHITTQELLLSEQKTFAERMLVASIENMVLQERLPLVYRNENIYEEAAALPEGREEKVRQNITSAVLLNLIRSVLSSRREENTIYRNSWYQVVENVYSTAEHSLQRMSLSIRQNIEKQTVVDQEGLQQFIQSEQTLLQNQLEEIKEENFGDTVEEITHAVTDVLTEVSQKIFSEQNQFTAGDREEILQQDISQAVRLVLEHRSEEEGDVIFSEENLAELTQSITQAVSAQTRVQVEQVLQDGARIRQEGDQFIEALQEVDSGSVNQWQLFTQEFSQQLAQTVHNVIEQQNSQAGDNLLQKIQQDQIVQEVTETLEQQYQVRLEEVRTDVQDIRQMDTTLVHLAEAGEKVYQEWDQQSWQNLQQDLSQTVSQVLEEQISHAEDIQIDEVRQAQLSKILSNTLNQAFQVRMEEARTDVENIRRVDASLVHLTEAGETVYQEGDQQSWQNLEQDLSRTISNVLEQQISRDGDIRMDASQQVQLSQQLSEALSQQFQTRVEEVRTDVQNIRQEGAAMTHLSQDVSAENLFETNIRQQQFQQQVSQAVRNVFEETSLHLARNILEAQQLPEQQVLQVQAAGSREIQPQPLVQPQEPEVPAPEMTQLTEENLVQASEEITQQNTQQIRNMLSQFSEENKSVYEAHLAQLNQQFEAARPRMSRSERLAAQERAMMEPEAFLQEFAEQTQRQEELRSAIEQQERALLPPGEGVRDDADIYQLIETYLTNPASLPEGVQISRNNIGSLLLDSKQVERSIEQQERVLREVEAVPQDIAQQVVEEIRSEGAYLPPGEAHTSRSIQRTNLFHRENQSEIDEEYLAELLRQSRSEQEKTVTETTQVQRTNVEQIQQVNETVERRLAQQNRDIQDLMQRSLNRQLGTLSDKVYHQIEKRLSNERRRRGV